MFLNQLEFQRYIQTSAKRANLNVEWREGVFPHTDGNKIVLPILSAKATEQDYRKQLHMATHEASHVLYTNFKELMETKCDAMRSFLGFLWNAVEDIRIESLNADEYEGDRSNSDDVFPDLAAEGLRKLEAATPKQLEEKKALLDKVLPGMWFMTEGYGQVYASAHKVVPRIEALLSPEAKAIVDKMKAGDYFDELRQVRAIEDPKKGTHAALELAKRLFKECFGLDPEKEMERLQKGKPEPKPVKASPSPKKDKGEEGKGKGKPEKKEDEGKGEGEGKDKDKSKPDQPGDGEDEGEGEGEAQAEQATMGEEQDGDGDDSEGPNVQVQYQEFLANSHEMKPLDKRSTPKRGMDISYEGYRGSRSYNPATKDEYLVGDFCKNTFTQDHLSQGNDTYLRAAYDAVAKGSSGPAFAARVRTRLQIRSKDRFEHGVKRGKLQTSLLHRVTIPNAQHLNERVFKRRIQSDTLNTAVCFLGDASGSMGGRKYSNLMGTAVQLNEAIGNVLNIPIEIHTFSDVGENPLMYVHRDFTTRRLSTDELLRRLCIAGNRMHGNPDGDAIVWSFDRLKQHKAKRKLLIVGSDGQPAAGRPGDIDWYTKEVVRRIEDETPIEIVGIGIMDDNVSRIYKEHYVISDSAELEQALLSLIDKKVR